jgi:hypothetical protein
MRYLFGFMCVCALGVMPLVGCSETGGTGVMPECQSPEDCDDSEGCTEDECTDGVCQRTPLEDETECVVEFLVGGGEPGFCEAASCVPQCEVLEEGDASTRGDLTGLCLGGSCQPPCEGSVCPCTEGGIRAAIAEGGGPFTFDCGDEPETVTTRATIVIDNDVILIGPLTVDGDDAHTVFLIGEATVELRGFAVTGGGGTVETSVKQAGPLEAFIGGILNDGTLMLTNSTVSGNSSRDVGGIFNSGNLTLTDSTVSANTATGGFLGDGGIFNLGNLTLTNSTVSGNTGTGVGGIRNYETLTLINSTVSGNMTSNPETAEARSIANALEATLTLANSLIDGDCSNEGVLTSNGYNIESPGDTCGFDQSTDQVNVTEGQLDLGPLAYNGGPTMTHALGAGSVAIDQTPAEDCVDADDQPLTTDQRGYPRPAGTTDPKKCDVGALEVQQHCFVNDECGPLICCHLGSPFEQGTCQTQSVCDELQGGA